MGKSNKNEGVHIIADFREPAISLAKQDAPGIPIDVESPIPESPKSISRSVNEGIQQLVEFNSPVQQLREKDQDERVS